jgi:hypothetical protein
MQVNYEISFQAILFPEIQSSLAGTQGAQSGPITGLEALEKREEPTTEIPTKQITKLSIQQRRLL